MRLLDVVKVEELERIMFAPEAVPTILEKQGTVRDLIDPYRAMFTRAVQRGQCGKMEAALWLGLLVSMEIVLQERKDAFAAAPVKGPVQ